MAQERAAELGAPRLEQDTGTPKEMSLSDISIR
jgi:hypothetical protein